MNDVLQNNTDGADLSVSHERHGQSNWQRLSGEITPVEIYWQGAKIQARKGDSVAVALLAAGIRSTRNNPVSNEARAAFCMMGSCFECMVKVDGVTEQACMVPVRDGMVINPVPLRELP